MEPASVGGFFATEPLGQPIKTITHSNIFNYNFILEFDFCESYFSKGSAVGTFKFFSNG